MASAKMGDDGDIVIRLSLKDKARFSSEANSAGKDIENLGKKAESSGKKFQSSSGGVSAFRKALSMGADLAIVTRGLQYAGDAIISTGVALYKSGADAYQTQLKYQGVFKELTPQVDQFIKTWNQKYGFPTKELEDATSLFAIFARGAGVAENQLVPFSTSIVSAAQDLAAFHNVDVKQVFSAMQSGLAGMIRPLRQYGIFMSNTMEQQEAVAMGLVKAGGSALDAKARLEALNIAQAKYNAAVSKFGESSVQAATAHLSMDKAQSAVDKAASKNTVTLTEQQKVLARQKLILDQAAYANGYLAKTIDSPANQLRMMKGRFLELQRTIGMAILPGINGFIHVLNVGLQGALKWLNDHGSDWATRFNVVLEKVKVALGDAAAAFKSGGWNAMTKNLDESAGAGGHLKTALDKIKGAFDDLVKIWDQGVYPLLKDAYDWFIKLGGPLALGAVAFGLHAVAENASWLKNVLIVLGVVLGLNEIATVALNVIEGIQTITKVALAGATFGLAAAQETAAIAAEEEFVAAGVLDAVLNSSLVTVGAVALAWIFNTGVMLAHAAVEGVVATATWALEAATWALNLAMDANPIMLVVIGLIALAAGVIYAYKHFGWFRAAVDATFSFLKMVVLDTIHFVTDHWKLIVAIIAGPTVLAVYLIVTHFNQIKDVFFGVIHFIEDHWRGIVSILTGPVGAAVIWITSHFDTIKNAFKDVVNFLITLWNDFANHLPAVHWSILGKHLDIDPGQSLSISKLHEGGTTTSPGLVNMKPGEELIYLPPAASVIPQTQVPKSKDVIDLSKILSQRPVHVHVILDGKEIARTQWAATADAGARR